MVVDFDAENSTMVDLDAALIMFAGSGADPLPPVNRPYPANAKFSRLVSRLVGKALAALVSEPPKPVDGDRHRFK